MKTWKNLLFLSCCTVFLLLPAFSSAEVKLTLKNGRSVIVENCREAGTKLICDMQGGSVEFNRQDIENIREVKIKGRAVSASPPDEVAADEQKKEEEKPAESIKIEGENSPAKSVGGLTAEQERRFDELEKRRANLAADRDKLIKDRESLHQEVKDTGVIRSREKLDAIQQKINALDERIKGFNEQVNKLNEEINALPTEGQKKK